MPRLGSSANPSSACVLLVCTESSVAASPDSFDILVAFPQSSSRYSPPSASIQSVRSLTACSSHCQCTLPSLLAVSAFAALPLRSSELAYLWLAGWLALVSSHIPTSSASKPPPSPRLLQIRSLTLRSLPIDLDGLFLTSHLSRAPVLTCCRSVHIEPKQIRLRTGTFADEARRLNDQHHPRHDQLDP